MLRRAFIMVSFLLFFSVNAAFAGDQISSVIECIRERYGRLPGLTVTYEREILTRSMAMLGDQTGSDQATGRIHFKPPHYLRVEQETPSPESIISDERTLWWYIPQKKQAYRYPSEKLGRELKIFSDIFQGLTKVEESFMLSLSSDDQSKEHRLELTPNPQWPDIDHIDLYLASGDCRIKRIEIYNILGGMTRFKLGKEIAEEEFEEGFFTFTPPEGVQVIRED